MLGNMPGSIPMPNSGIMSSPATPVPAVTPPPVTGMGGNVMANNPLAAVFRAIFDPKGAAADMAAKGVTPEDMKAQLGKGNQLSETMKAGVPQTGMGGNVLFGNNPLSKLGQSLRADTGTPASISSMMNPVKQGKTEQMVQGNVQRSNDILTPGGMNIMQPGGDHPGISAATPDNFVTISDVIKNLFGGVGGLPGAPGAPSMAPVASTPTPMPGQPAPMNAVPPMPIVPPTTAAQVPSPGMPPPGVTPVVPPVVPPKSEVTPTPAAIADDYASGKIKSSVMGGAGGNAPDSQLKGNSIFNEFMGTMKAGGITNPNALAAIAATTKSESGFDEKNFYGSWKDPSQSGASGTSGGAMSWRNERFQAMKDFVKANGGDPNKPSAALQAKFFMQEDPNLIAALNAAKTPEEAQQLMNNAWKFAGYDDPAHGEAARRIALARNFASSGSFGDLSGIIPAASQAGANPVTASAAGAGTGAGAGASGLTDPGSANPDLNLPSAPSPIGPRPGQYSPDANVMKMMLMLLTGAGGGSGVQSISQLMQGQGKAA